MSATEYVNGPPHMLCAVLRMTDLDLTVAQVVDEDVSIASRARARALLSAAGHRQDLCRRRVLRLRQVRGAWGWRGETL